MPMVFPSQIVEYIDRRIDVATKQAPSGTPPYELAFNHTGVVRAVLELVDQLPAALIALDSEQYAEFLEAISDLREAVKIWSTGNQRHKVSKMFGGSSPTQRLNPLTVVRRALASCPDEAVPPTATELKFVTDEGLREALRLDIASADRALLNGEWKSATVLAGSVIEALLLWALAKCQSANATGFSSAVATAQTSEKWPKPPPKSLENWNLHQFIPVATKANLISSDTAAQCQLARGFRNLIHPGRAKRLDQACSRATALSAVAAVEHVISDLSTPARKFGDVFSGSSGRLAMRGLVGRKLG